MDDEKQQLDATIEGARDRVGERIDELDRRIRKRLDIKSIASEHAPQLVAGGAVVGFLGPHLFPMKPRPPATSPQLGKPPPAR